jgi:hypothetical protein
MINVRKICAIIRGMLRINFVIFSSKTGLASPSKVQGKTMNKKFLNLNFH